MRLNSNSTLEDCIDVNTNFDLDMHDIKISIHNQKSFINNVVFKITSKMFFLKLYLMENNNWEFHDYCYLKFDISMKRVTLVTYKSKLILFNILMDNFKNQISKHDESDKHVIIINKKTKFLLYSPYPQIINCILEKN